MDEQQLTEAHATQLARIARLWSQGPASDEPDLTAFMPLLTAVGLDAGGRLVERTVVATPRAHSAAAVALGRALAQLRVAPVTVTQAAEVWMVSTGPDEASNEALVVATARADGRTVTTVRAIVRSEGGEAALGDVVEDAVFDYGAGLAEATFATYRSAAASP